jgi:hypothetical protein
LPGLFLLYFRVFLNANFKEANMATHPVTQDDQRVPQIQRVTAVFWPSFLTAIPVTAFFFSLFHPLELANLLGHDGATSLAGYTMGFFAFWAAAAVSSGLTLYFANPCQKASHN